MEELTQKEEILEQLNFIKETTPEELRRIIIDSITLYIKSVITLGFDSNAAQESLNIIKEMIKIVKEEKKILSLINKNIDDIDLDKTVDFIDDLELLNERTFIFYDNILTEIEIACEMKQKQRILRNRNGIDSLITNDYYKRKALELTKKEE